MSENNKKTICIAYAFGGAIALIYQIIWFHAFVEEFGASGTTFLVVLCTFIGSLGAGSLVSDRVYEWIEKRFGGRGFKNYGRTELAIALTGITLLKTSQLAGTTLAGDFPYRLVAEGGLQYWVPSYGYQLLKICSAIFAIAVPCFLMGMTFPYLCSLFPEDRSFPSMLYAANTLGACLSVLVIEFFGLEILGYLGCLSLAAIGNVLIGLFFLYRSRQQELALSPSKSSPQSEASISIFPAVLSGFLCGGLQALGFILLKLTLGPSKASYALLTFFAIFAIWAAASFVHRWHPSRKMLLAGIWIGFAWCVWIWMMEPRISQALVLYGIRNLAKSTPYSAAFVTTAATIGFQIFLPYLLWSTLLPDLCDRLHSAKQSVSRVYAYNTFSFLISIAIFGWALQYIHFFFAAKVFALCSFAGLIILTLSRGTRPVSKRVLAAGSVFLVIFILIIPKTLNLNLIGGLSQHEKHSQDYRSTPQHLFWVRYDAKEKNRALMFDRHSMSATGASNQTYMRGMAHFPLLLHRNPEKALLICFGVGVTADAIREHDSIQRLDIVDLNRSVFQLNHNFDHENHNVLKDQRIRIIIDDGRQFLKLTPERYDFVTMEPPPPLQLGISRLYSKEFYASILNRLNPGGLVSQWLPESQMDQRAVDMIVSTFVQAFPHTLMFDGCQRELILVGSNEPFDFSRLFRAIPPDVERDMKEFRVGPQQFLRSVLRIEGMRKFWGDGEIISDGFTSLESIQIGPVQMLHPRNEFDPFKRNLIYDMEGVPADLRKTSSEAAEIVSSFYSDPRSDPFTIRIVPARYFPR